MGEAVAAPPVVWNSCKKQHAVSAGGYSYYLVLRRQRKASLLVWTAKK